MVTIKENKEGLVVGHFTLAGITNKRNRNKRLDKLIKTLKTEILDMNKYSLQKESYDKLISSSQMTFDTNKAAPFILIDMVSENSTLPTISRVVDAMNYVSVKSGLTISIWDGDQVNGDIAYRYSHEGEKYHPFMGDEVSLTEGELIAVDDEKVLCLVRYRDSQYAPVTLETKNIIIHIQGVYEISKEEISVALEELKELLLGLVEGEVSDFEVT